MEKKIENNGKKGKGVLNSIEDGVEAGFDVFVGEEFFMEQVGVAEEEDSDGLGPFHGEGFGALHGVFEEFKGKVFEEVEVGFAAFEAGFEKVGGDGEEFLAILDGEAA